MPGLSNRQISKKKQAAVIWDQDPGPHRCSGTSYPAMRFLNEAYFVTSQSPLRLVRLGYISKPLNHWPKIMQKSKEQKVSEAEVERFRKDLGPFVVAAETTRMAMVFTDSKTPGNHIIFANDSFLALTGYTREEVLGQNFNFMMIDKTDIGVTAQIEAAFAGNLDQDPEVHYQRKNGEEFWAAIFICPVRDEAGDVIQHFASFVDLTKHKTAQAHSAMLIDELNHRVKNTLASVQSITSQAFKNSSDLQEIRHSIESRLFALSRSHDLLTLKKWEGAGLLDLIHDALQPFGIQDQQQNRFAVTGANIRLTPKMTLALGIAFHELATNAMKYGALSNESGSITIAWTVEPAPDGDRLILHWREKGGPLVVSPSRKGFGSRVIEHGLPHELSGKVYLNYLPEGVACTIEIPISKTSLNA